MFGVAHNDTLVDMDGRTGSNNAGGVVGGITNGNDLVFRIAIKPTSSTPKEQESLNWETGQVEKFSIKGRHDLCIALRVPPVLEAVAAMTIADLLLLEGMRSRVVR
jgi:chorismate synthase